jgi:hypothetical protein
VALCHTGANVVPSGRVLEEDTLDGIFGAVAEDLFAARVDEVRHPPDPAG